MSVTFSVEFVEVLGYKSACLCGNFNKIESSYHDAITVTKNFNEEVGCRDSYGYPCEAFITTASDVDGMPSLNVSNTNAFNLLRQLKIEVNPADGLYGSISSSEMLEKIEEALRNIDRKDSYGSYLFAKLNQIYDVALMANKGNRKVVWG